MRDDKQSTTGERVGGLSMETLKNFLWPIVAIGGLGALIDFLIGKTGQARAKDFLLKWWVRFDDVRWKNFGREEGLFAGRLVEQWLGRKIWSVQRAIVGPVLFCYLLVLGYIVNLVVLGYIPISHVCFYCNSPVYQKIIIAATA